MTCKLLNPENPERFPSNKATKMLFLLIDGNLTIRSGAESEEASVVILMSFKLGN